MSTFLAVTIGSYALAALFAAMGVLSHKFDDNLVQRIGLGITSIGACCAAAYVWRMRYALSDLELYAMEFLGVGLAIYGAGTVWKFWRDTK